MEEGVDNQRPPQLPRKEGTFSPEGLPIETINNIAVNVLSDFVSGKANEYLEADPALEGILIDETIDFDKGTQIFRKK